MSEQNFVDYVKICLRSGRGGAGSSHFFRDRINPKGGPDGGDGGNGGNIILRGNKQMWTLLHLKYRKHVIAGNATVGSGSRKTGADGESITLEVPLGTVVKDSETSEVIIEITEEGQEYIALKGGRGGRGNSNFKSPTNQSPRYAQPGEDGKEEWTILELKVLADVGLVGFPNAGKSTLLSAVTAAKPKIADYAFTTLKPNLGIVQYRNSRSFVMADIPGIIEDAHLGKGLGIRFLRHIERNSVLLFIIPADTDNIRSEYETLVNELKMYNPELLDKPRLLGISKYDLIDKELEEMITEDIPQQIPHIFFSSVTEYNIVQLKDKLWELIDS
ncbi:MAG: GTPase ObgE [Saprospiraceae bacterium]